MKQYFISLIISVCVLSQPLVAHGAHQWLPKLKCDEGQTLIEEFNYPNLIDPLTDTPRHRTFRVSTVRWDLINISQELKEFRIDGEPLMSWAHAKGPILEGDNHYFTKFVAELRASSSGGGQSVFTLQLSEADSVRCIEEEAVSGCYAGDTCVEKCILYERLKGAPIYKTSIVCTEVNN